MQISRYNKLVRIWLFTGLIMVFFQIIIGGITRLTGSGLSITRWEIITGTLPPMNLASWELEFDKYKETPQYKKINDGMSLSEFKFIYFWEYIHRLWARLMGFVFIIPFIIFIRKGWIDRKLIGRLIVVILLAIFVASLGWIMVASGLINRPWVNAYKLSFHLCAALVLFGYLLWTFFCSLGVKEFVFSKTKLRWARGLLIVLAIQIFLGGIMSGMKAGLSYPTWPDMNGELVPEALFDSQSWIADTFIDYDKSLDMAMIIQFFHRGMAYIFVLLTSIFFVIYRRKKLNFFFSNTLNALILITFFQVILGILTVINCKGSIPLWYGVLHQAFAIFLLSITLILNFQIRQEK